MVAARQVTAAHLRFNLEFESQAFHFICLFLIQSNFQTLNDVQQSEIRLGARLHTLVLRVVAGMAWWAVSIIKASYRIKDADAYIRIFSLHLYLTLN